MNWSAEGATKPWTIRDFEEAARLIELESLRPKLIGIYAGSEMIQRMLNGAVQAPAFVPGGTPVYFVRELEPDDGRLLWRRHDGSTFVQSFGSSSERTKRTEEKVSPVTSDT